jgi:hypothetical protein
MKHPVWLLIGLVVVLAALDVVVAALAPTALTGGGIAPAADHRMPWLSHYLVGGFIYYPGS